MNFYNRASRSHPVAPLSHSRWGLSPGAPLVIAHRGASARALENTEAAFAAAVEAGADGVELDVRLAKGGDVVVFHDDTLERLSDRRERVDRLSLRQLRAVELIGGHRILTLAEALELLAGCLVNVEIKARLGVAIPAGLVEHTIGIIARSRAADRVLLSSFHPLVLARVRAMSDLAIGFLFDGEPGGVLHNGVPARTLAASAVHPPAGFVTRSLVRRWHRRGLAVNTWTVDRPAEIRRLVRAGVDALITNDPASTRSVMAGMAGRGR